MTPAPFVIHERVRWGDVDYAGIIRYDAYTRFMELAESELFRSIGIAYREFVEQFDFTIPRRAMHVDFESPPRLDERIATVAYISHVGTTSLTLNFDFYGDGGVVRATGHLVLVCLPKGATRAAPWPADFIARLAPYRLSSEQARATVPFDA
ncbi:MAG: acyl-CoA thioesterase [Gemmatimonadaceae bacterium]|nr:acyl-CoA thioesterase [Gemmatimonadaceae bacterium]